ncbi:MAG TPA: DUF4397 domain-containing protein [Gemmatimonadaceae bacterium]|nr:DUF4397 domain-containing protein [Gemmatimonadaceae bacterium]
MKIRRLAILPLLPLMLAGCGLDSLGLENEGLSTRVRFMNASPGSPALTLFLNERPVVTQVPYGEVSAYIALEPALYSIRMGTYGDQSEASTASLVSGTFRPIAGVSYTLFAAGPGEAPQAMLAVDTGVVPSAGKVKVRAINAAPSAPPIDVHLVTWGRSPEESTRLLTPFMFGAGASHDHTGYVERDADRYHLVVTFEGTADILLDVSPMELAAGQARTIVILDGSDGELFARVVADRH